MDGSVRRTRRAVIAVLCASLVAGLLVTWAPRPAGAAVFSIDKAWPSRDDGYTIIPVCIENTSSAIQENSGSTAHDPNPTLDAVVGRIRDALRRGWEAVSSVRFVDWRICTDLTTAERSQAVGFRIHPDVGNASGIGTDARGDTNATNIKPWGNFTQCITYSSSRAKSEYSFDCAEQYALHELGHAIGFRHEWIHPLTVATCTAVTGDTPLPVDYDRTQYYIPNATPDLDSIMTYNDECADVTGVRFGSKLPSSWDRTAVANRYPPVPARAMDVGVVPDQRGGCPDPTEVLIHLDDENDGNANARSGWIGATASTTDTTLAFCKVDGRQLASLPISATGSAAYAVLKLGTTCPNGSTEFVRFHDDHNPGQVNENWIAGEAGPNVRTTDTWIHWCLFRPSATATMDAFPDLGFDYGVLAAPSFPYATETGWVLVDDENSSNANALLSGTGAALDIGTLTAVLPIVGAFSDTIYNFARVAPAPVPANDAFASAAPLAIGGGTLTASTTSSTVEAGEPAVGPDGLHTVWYRYTAPVAGTLTVDVCGSVNPTWAGLFNGSAVGALQGLAKVNSTCSPAKAMTRTVAAGESLLVQVSGDRGTAGPFRLTWSFNPANDRFRDAALLTTAAGTVTGLTAGATREAGEPVANDDTGHSVWYLLRAATTGLAVLDTCGSEAPTQLAAYSGARLDSLVRLATDATSCAGRSRIRFAVTAGQDYPVQVDSRGGATGLVQLSWHIGPANDEQDLAAPLSGPSGSVEQANAAATTEPGEVFPGGTNGGRSLWWTYTPAQSTVLEVDACNSNFDTVLGVYTGSGPTGSLVPVALDDDSCINRSRAVVDVTAGTTYRIQVGGKGGATGTVRLAWRLGPVLQVGQATVVEGDQGTVTARVPVRLSVPAAGPVTFHYATEDGTAQSTGKKDFRAVQGTITIPAGRVWAEVKVPVLGDRRAEGDESFAVIVSDLVGALPGELVGGVSIRERESTVPEVSIGGATVFEGHAGSATVRVPLTLSEPVASPVTVTFSLNHILTDAADIGPFTATSVTIPAGKTQAVLTFSVVGDRAKERNEWLGINLISATGASVGYEGITLFLVDDD